ncbi:hypothetical protein HDU98_011275 [Podochytrium sp. JEL0797]|nr:hypothetical protein HDU98_011275 [Podochytrium sp. JEL0797]
MMLEGVSSSYYDLLEIGCHIATGLSVLSIAFNLSLTIVVLLNFGKLLQRSSGSRIMVLSVLVLCIASILCGALIILLNEMWDLASGFEGPLYTSVTGNFLAAVTYIVLVMIFAANFLIALERHWLIRFNKHLGKSVVVAVVVMAIFFSVCFIVSFSVTLDQVNWLFLPFAVPGCGSHEFHQSICLMKRGHTILFAVGLIYFPLIAIIIVAVYASSFTLIAKEIKINEIQRAVLTRSILMSMGIVICYCPAIILTCVAITNVEFFLHLQYDENIQFAFTIIPAFDPLWTPFLILLFQQEFQDVYFASARKVLDVVLRRGGNRGDNESL